MQPLRSSDNNLYNDQEEMLGRSLKDLGLGSVEMKGFKGPHRAYEGLRRTSQGCMKASKGPHALTGTWRAYKQRKGPQHFLWVHVS